MNTLQERVDEVLERKHELADMREDVKKYLRQNLTHAQIAARLGIKESSVRFIVHQLRDDNWYLDKDGYIHAKESDVPMPIWDACRKKFNARVTARKRKAAKAKARANH